MVETRFLDRVISFDRESGLLRAEAGISLDAILRFCVPLGWFLPTTPGTRQVTLGGAIANDVHGKNHHSAGCFGNHVRSFELLRSDGFRGIIRAGDALHAATIGGLGLTGFITWADIQLVPIKSAFIDVERIRFRGFREFLDLAQESSEAWEHTVAWVDCLASGRSQGRGIFMRGNWSAAGGLQLHAPPRATIPTDSLAFLLNRYTMSAFNVAYYHRATSKWKSSCQHYSQFFHPLDDIQNWNRLYGRRGFQQYHCVIPFASGSEPVVDLLDRISNGADRPFLAVIKTFGSIASPGMISFPAPGFTLALDFANNGASTAVLFDDLDRIVRLAGGRLYPAKDTRMSGADFEQFYPRLDEFRRHIDPSFSSDFWRRMNS